MEIYLNETEKLVNQCHALQGLILKRLKQLPNHGKNCDCDKPCWGFEIVEDYEINNYCLRCGGYLVDYGNPIYDI